MLRKSVGTWSMPGVQQIPTVSPTRPMGFGTRYIGQPCGPAGEFGYDALQSPPVMDNELPHTFRGMVVEEGYNAGHQLVALPQSGPGPNPYDTYPQPEYDRYYQSVGREPYVDYLYEYDAYHPIPESSYAIPSGMVGLIPPTLYSNLSSTDPHRQQAGPFFDYGRNVRQPVSQSCYPFLLPILYPPPRSPMHAPQLAVTTLNAANKTQDFHVSFCRLSQGWNSLNPPCWYHMQQIASSDVMLEYSPQQPVLSYGYSPHSHPFHLQGLCHPPHDIAERPMLLRHSLLNEFRSNKSRKWELKVPN
jgi:hypothetical protein